MNMQAMDKWHHTKPGYITFAVLEIILAYIFASLAINSGSLWQYAIAFILIFGSLQNLVKFFIKPKDEHKKR
jgi:heme/copper-type cytochrome/quinol oxidase subunit 4